MNHLQQFRSRKVLSLPILNDQGWRLKRYAILAKGKSFDENIVTAAGTEAIKQLPDAGKLEDAIGNHGVGFQIIHFAETAVVSPVFYWRWGSVLANAEQIRANWEAPTEFKSGIAEVIGCIWEMDVVNFEVDVWKTILLSGVGTPETRLATYLDRRLVAGAKR